MKRLALAFTLVACVDGCAVHHTYQDITGSGRGNAQLQMDTGRCNMMGSQAAVQQQALQNNNCSTKGNCAAVGFANGLAQGAARNETFNNCMQAAGWQVVGP